MLGIMAGIAFYDPAYMAVTCSEFACGVQDYGFFWEMTSGGAVFSASWFDSGYTVESVYEGAGYFTYFYVKVDLDPAVRSLCPFTPAFADEEVAALQRKHHA